MANIHLILAGPPQAPYPNGGDEAYWMGQVAGALASHLAQWGVPFSWGPPEGPGGLCLALSSQASPPPLEGRRKGPNVLFPAADPAARRAALSLAGALRQAYPQPEFLTLEALASVAELKGLPGTGVAVRLLYRDNPQDEAWLTRNAGAAGKALAQGLARLYA